MRAAQILRAACWWAVALASLVWWAAAIALALARFPLGRLRFALVILTASVLRDVGATGAAVAVYVRERRRCDRKVAAIRVRRVDHR